MSFTFNPDHMIQDLTALSKVASRFFVARSQGHVQRLADNLRHGVANAKAGGQASFTWRTDDGASIQISESKSWKGGTGDYGALVVDVRLDYDCHYNAADGRVQAEGVAAVTIRDVASGKEKVVHFDVEKGGWDEIRDGTRFDRAGHPPFHAQFHGFVNDIPRMPILIVHPIDVITFTILELHQKRWREHIGTYTAKASLRDIPLRQRMRLTAILKSWTEMISDTSVHAIVAMQRPFAAPLAL
jgi:hypothetical protein